MRLYEACQDKGLMKELQKFFQDTLETVALERVFNREDVSAVADARDIIDKAFEDIDIQFAPKVEPKEIINEAR